MSPIVSCEPIASLSAPIRFRGASPRPSDVEADLAAVRGTLVASSLAFAGRGEVVRRHFERAPLLGARFTCEVGAALWLPAATGRSIAVVSELVDAATSGDSLQGDGEALATALRDGLLEQAAGFAMSLAGEADVRASTVAALADCAIATAQASAAEALSLGTLPENLEAYETGARDASAAHFAIPLELCLRATGAPSRERAAAARCAGDLGVAWRLQSDAIDFGGHAADGLGSSLRSGRATAPAVVYADRCHDFERALLEEFLFFAPLNAGAAPVWAQTIAASDAVDATIARCVVWQRAALEASHALSAPLQRAIRQATRRLFAPIHAMQAARFDTPSSKVSRGAA